jgi:hypothetical protein
LAKSRGVRRIDSPHLTFSHASQRSFAETFYHQCGRLLSCDSCSGQLYALVCQSGGISMSWQTPWTLLSTPVSLRRPGVRIRDLWHGCKNDDRSTVRHVATHRMLHAALWMMLPDLLAYPGLLSRCPTISRDGAILKDLHQEHCSMTSTVAKSLSSITLGVSALARSIGI